MLANQLITHHYPTVDPDDKISLGLQLMDDFDILHLAVVDHNKFLGIINKDDLLDADDHAPVKVIMSGMLQKFFSDIRWCNRIVVTPDKTSRLFYSA